MQILYHMRVVELFLPPLSAGPNAFMVRDRVPVTGRFAGLQPELRKIDMDSLVDWVDSRSTEGALRRDRIQGLVDVCPHLLQLIMQHATGQASKEVEQIES